MLGKEITLDASVSLCARRDGSRPVRGHGIGIISQIIWSPQPGSSSNDFRERKSTIRKRDESGANHPGPIAVSKPVWCLGGAAGGGGGGILFLSLLGKKKKRGDVSYFTFFFFSHFQMLPTLAGVIQRDPREIAKRLAWRRYDSTAHFGGGGVLTVRYAACNRRNTFRYH